MPGGETTRSIVVSPGATTTYTVTDAGDLSDAVATVTLDLVNPLPTVTINPTDRSICWGVDTEIELTGLSANTQYYIYHETTAAFGPSSYTTTLSPA